MTALLTWILTNPGTVAGILASALSLASAVAEALGRTGLSKVLGTITLDSGRLVRYAKLLLEARKALAGK